MLDFKCEKCGHIEEELFRGSREELDATTIQCPECDGDMKPIFQNRPTHGKHASWTTWRVG